MTDVLAMNGFCELRDSEMLDVLGGKHRWSTHDFVVSSSIGMVSGCVGGAIGGAAVGALAGGVGAGPGAITGACGGAIGGGVTAAVGYGLSCIF